MDNDRIDELAAEIVTGSKAAMVDPTAIFGFIQAIIAAIQQCRENRAKRLARRARRGRLVTRARLAQQIAAHLRSDQDETLLREQSVELAERTLEKAGTLGERELVEIVEEFQDHMEW